MRALAALLLAATPATAWEFTPGLPCLLTHDTGTARIELTYDPTGPRYTVTVEQATAWPEAPVFSMRFDGPAGQTISTTRQTMSAQGRAVTVEDTGFGNVLDGLQFNDTATAILGDAETSFPLAEAAEPVAKFRDCRAAPGV